MRALAPGLMTRISDQASFRTLSCRALPYPRCGLDAHATVGIGQLVAGVGVEIVGSAAVELVSLTDLSTHNQPNRQRPKRSRDPADCPQQMRLIRLGLLDGGYWLLRRTAGVFILSNRFTTVGRTPTAAEFRKEPHACMIPQESYASGVKLIACVPKRNQLWFSFWTYWTSTCSKPSATICAVTRSRAFLLAASRMPSFSAVSCNWSCALARRSGVRDWSAGAIVPVVRE